MENIYKNKINELDSYITYLEDRGLRERVINKKKVIKEINFIEYDEPVLLEVGPTKVIYSEEELKIIEEEAKKVEKPRGWHFKKEFMDSEGNVYHKGKLQPHLKGTL
jgi:chaperonin cofactor prefoldin